jgi:hypothetical protein
LEGAEGLGHLQDLQEVARETEAYRDAARVLRGRAERGGDGWRRADRIVQEMTLSREHIATPSETYFHPSNCDYGAGTRQPRIS